MHNELLASGFDSRMLIQRAPALPGVTALENTVSGRWHQTYLRVLERLPLYLYPNRSRPVLFSVGWVGNNLPKHPLVRRVDIIHMHWVNAGMLSVHSIPGFRQPVVWTVRDMWPLTGGCHYSLGCEKYQEGCGACPRLGSRRHKDLSKIMFEAKRARFGSIHPVAISHWLKESMERSPIFAGHDVKVIHNGIDTREYYPVEKESARTALGIPGDRKVVLVGSQFVLQPFKGFDFFLEALRDLDPEQYRVVVFGNADNSKLAIDKNRTHMLGFLPDRDQMRLAYSAADVFVAPSVQEAFGKTLVESMACGTPVVCFDLAGPKDIVTHLVDGYRAKPLDPTDLAQGIQWAADPAKAKGLSDNARSAAVGKFDIRDITRSYVRMYEELGDRGK